MPEDRTPEGGEVMHQPPENARIPEREPRIPPRAGEVTEDKSQSGGGKTDFVQTPD